MIKKTLVWVLPLVFCLLPAIGSSELQPLTDEAARIYAKHKESVYQIRIINLDTDKKTTIGSGFQISSQGHIATNYHVISDVVHEPQRHRLEFLTHDGSVGPLKVIDIDVIHDLAIVKSAQRPSDFIRLGAEKWTKGARVFSMGNPFDLGMTIIEGTYNGHMKNALYKKILFSGSLNPGMSGGPALDHNGEVMGVNVSTAGNQVSFLVPVDYLRLLYARIKDLGDQEVKRDWKAYIQQQLYRHQDRYLEDIIQSEWKHMSIGDARVPAEISNIFKCWGRSEEAENKLYRTTYTDCYCEDVIYVSNTLSTGQIIYRYNWVSGEKMNAIRFYNLFEELYTYHEDYDNAERKDVTNFQCQDSFVRISGQKTRVSMCARKYKDYPQLFDVHVAVASVHLKNRGLLTHLSLLGIGKTRAQAFVKKFLENIKWKK
ncbi:MAG: serine protease [Candidatus Omnitrophica bacterium]|nr:serine protease [Candidatus Omnitrophota bacterium]